MAGTSDEMWQQYRREMLAETERFIEWGLRHPELVHWIPAKPVGRGGFPTAVAQWFYQTVFVAGQNVREGLWARLRWRRGGA